MGKTYLPKSPLSALPATGVLAGFGTDFMTNHAFGRGTVAVPVAWIDCLAPHARFILQAVRLRNRMRIGKADFSGQHSVESILYLVRCLLCMFASKCCACPPVSRLTCIHCNKILFLKCSKDANFVYYSNKSDSCFCQNHAVCDCGIQRQQLQV